MSNRRFHRRDPDDVRAPSVLFSTSPSEPSVAEAEFTADEMIVVLDIQAKAEANQQSLREVVKASLPSLKPSLIIKLRRATEHAHEAVRTIAQELGEILEGGLEQAKQTLKELLGAGEIRKLDALIGKAARAGKLDVAFFNVLTMNLQNAQEESGGDRVAAADFEPGKAASRLQILQHIYTRCQEEVEKSIPAGSALLNKLLRTDQEAIRANLYRHYLTPQPQTIETPDGKKVELEGVQPVLVPLSDFVDAIGQAVKQVRTLEKAGATDQEAAAAMVEAFRTIAKEARLVLGESYGVGSSELFSFEEGLQPVFRPSSPDSPYIKGETTS